MLLDGHDGVPAEDHGSEVCYGPDETCHYQGPRDGEITSSVTIDRLHDVLVFPIHFTFVPPVFLFGYFLKRCNVFKYEYILKGICIFILLKCIHIFVLPYTLCRVSHWS